MIRVAILDPNGKVVLPKELLTAADLHDAVEQARRLIHDCESLVQPKKPIDPARGSMPYLS